MKLKQVKIETWGPAIRIESICAVEPLEWKHVRELLDRAHEHPAFAIGSLIAMARQYEVDLEHDEPLTVHANGPERARERREYLRMPLEVVAVESRERAMLRGLEPAVEAAVSGDVSVLRKQADARVSERRDELARVVIHLRNKAKLSPNGGGKRADFLLDAVRELEAGAHREMSDWDASAVARVGQALEQAQAAQASERIEPLKPITWEATLHVRPEATPEESAIIAKAWAMGWRDAATWLRGPAAVEALEGSSNPTELTRASDELRAALDRVVAQARGRVAPRDELLAEATCGAITFRDRAEMEAKREGAELEAHAIARWLQKQVTGRTDPNAIALLSWASEAIGAGAHRAYPPTNDPAPEQGVDDA